MNVVQIILLAIVTFVFAIDQYSLTETLYRPIVACTIIGAILGDLQVGLLVGGTYEIMVIGNMPVGGAQPPNVVIAGVAGCILAITAKMDVNAALGAAIIFSVFGQYVVTLVFTFMASLMAKADKAAEEANPAGIAQVNYISMCILGALFAVISILCYVGGTAMADTLKQLSTDYSWLMGGLSVAGGMMKFVGFAILMKIMMASDLWGFLLAGFASAIIVQNIPTAFALNTETGAVTAAGNLSGVTLLLLAFIGVCVAIYDYMIHIKIKENAGSGIEGGMNDGI